MKLRILICGDREYEDASMIHAFLRKLISQGHQIECVIEGECRGADLLARKVAEGMAIPVEKFPALWDTYGRSAGPIRNRQMIIEGQPNLVAAFHSDIKNSRGTLDMIFAANKAGLPVRLYA
jgi:hypothetical protein